MNIEPENPYDVTPNMEQFEMLAKMYYEKPTPNMKPQLIAAYNQLSNKEKEYIKFGLPEHIFNYIKEVVEPSAPMSNIGMTRSSAPPPAPAPAPAPAPVKPKVKNTKKWFGDKHKKTKKNSRKNKNRRITRRRI